MADRERPFAFLVSTTGCARSIKTNLGAPAYSYVFVLDALAPVLERFGNWRLIERPESSLAFAAARAAADGFRPVHVSLNPPQDGYATPALPTIVFPFWEFPDIPDRDFGYDTRQNWVRMCRPANLILTACESTAEAFRRARVRCPVAVVPVPIAPEQFDLPDWEPTHRWTITCRHTELGRAEVSPSTGRAPRDAANGFRRHSWSLARSAFHRIYPWLDPRTVDNVARVKESLLAVSRHSPPKLAYIAIRATYRRTIRRCLSVAALERITRSKNHLLAAMGKTPAVVVDPLLPATALTLSGLVYTSIFNLGDLRKNYLDLLSAFLIAFRDRPDVTLVFKLATSPHREHTELKLLRENYESLGLRHACRVVVITDYLTEAQMRELMRVTTYYVNSSHSEGACLPLQQALAGGRPAIAPRHTAMADYMDNTVGFVPRSHPEPTYWPQDPEFRLTTERHRLVWSDIHQYFCASAELFDSDPDRYRGLAAAARERMRSYASRDVVTRVLRAALETLPAYPERSLAWAS
jgi:glycosyltransferase involved in cell wall biosynthesis